MNVVAAADQVVATLRDAARVLLVTHTHPDGDALGSLTALRLALDHIGTPVDVFQSEEDLVLPDELEPFRAEAPVDESTVRFDDRVVVFLDCGNASRSTLGGRLEEMGTIVNIDHHHDNTGFGTINLLDFDASSTAEIVWDLVGRLGAPLTEPIAEALYVGLITDTGRFSYENTTPRAHQMAAELLAAGIDVTAIRRRLYEDIGPGKLHLLRYALDSFVLHGGGSVISARITAADFDAAGATEAQSEGIIDVIRGVRGVRIAALARELETRAGSFKVSLRAADPTVDVSAIARAGGGGGHPQAAGFVTQLSDAGLAEFLLAQLAEQDAAVSSV
ncbi:MAG: DHH family phosphoesterase [Solirubrobacteraceae bacterium]|nr:DHH family phosphoesterase [Solirubrobacteraceae bacterium]